MKFQFDVEAIRKQFPACAQQVNGNFVAHLDLPARSQVPQRVTDRIADYLTNHNANEGGYFPAAAYSEQLEDQLREAAADLLGCLPEEIGFGCSTTQNNYRIAYSVFKQLKPGDEVVLTEMEHRANSAPWYELERCYGVVVKQVRVDPVTRQIDLADLEAKLSSRTKVATFNWASNVTGTVSDVKKMCEMARQHDALTIVDAVHYAAHFPVDVKELGADILMCSAYKWFGPHVGIVYMRKGILETLDLSGVKTPDTLEGPRQFHFGTPQYELFGGVVEAVEFIASIGRQYETHYMQETAAFVGRRKQVVAGMLAIDEHEAPLSKRLREGLRELSGLTMYGPPEGQPRTPTISFTVEGMGIDSIAEQLAAEGINAWHGDFYAVELCNNVLGVAPYGGVVRFGLAPYNREEDVERTLAVMKKITARR